jgi:hypothetical protein
MTGNITWGTGDSEERKVRGKMAVGQGFELLYEVETSPKPNCVYASKSDSHVLRQRFPSIKRAFSHTIN